MTSDVGKYWWLYMLRGLLALGFGASVMVTAILFPGITVQALVILFGAYLLASGAVAAITALFYRPESFWGSLLLNGVLSMGVGALAFAWTEVTAVALVLVFAFWLVVTGLLDIVSAVRLRHLLERQWTIGLSGLIAVVVGTVILLYPAIGALGLMWLFGGFVSVSGLFSLSCGWQMHKLRKAVEHEREAPPYAESEPA